MDADRPDAHPSSGNPLIPNTTTELLAPSPPDASGTATLPPHPNPGEAFPDAAHAHVPAYEIIRELGRGGMGVVYQARQPHLNRTVALKMILSGGHASEADLARFLAEAEAVAQLQHPNIVQLFESGQHQGLPYFTLEYVGGGSLAQKLHGVPLPPTEAARLVEQLSRAVHVAHQQGIIHRDLKPGNVLLTEDGTPKVTDFGLAKQLASPGCPSGEGLTATGAVLGTPSYMAPEQAEGKKVGPAADVYALGAILYECLTGRPPFQGPTPLDVILQVIADDPVPPTDLQPKLPRDLETICIKCLQKEPHKRYASGETLAEDLRHFQEGKPIVARSVGSVERAVKWVKRRPAVAALLAAVLVVFTAGSGASTYFAVHASREARAATEETYRANLESERARKNEYDALQNLYVSHMNQARFAWQLGQAGRVRDLLDAQTPSRSRGYDFRGFEWHYWNRCCHSDLLTLTGYGQPVRTVAYSPDGRLIALGGGEKNALQPSGISIRDADTGEEIRRLEGQSGSVACLTFSPDGNHLASVEEQGKTPREDAVKVWDLQSGKLHTAFAGHSSVAFGPDGQLLVTVRFDQKTWTDDLVIRDWAAGKDVKTVKGLNARICSVAFSPDGKRLAAGSNKVLRMAALGLFAWNEAGVGIWEVETGKKLLALRLPDDVLSVAFSPDGNHLATAVGPTIKVWDSTAGREILALTGHSFTVSSVAYSHDGKRLASASHDQTVRLWDPATGKELNMLKGHTDGVQGVVFSPDGQRLASAGLDNAVKIWEPTRTQEAFTFTSQVGARGRLAFHPDGKQLAYGGGGVTLWDITTGRQTGSFSHVFDLMLGPTLDFAFSPDGQRLVIVAASSFTNYDNVQVRTWDTGTRAQVYTFRPGFHVSTMVFSPDGKHLALGGKGKVEVREASSGRMAFEGPGATGLFSSVVYSPNGQLLATGIGSQEANQVKADLKLRDAVTGREVRSFPGQEGPFLRAAFSADGRHLASVSDQQVVVWDVDTGTELRSFRFTSSRTLALSPDSRRLASASPDGLITIWDMGTGQQVLTLRGFSSQMELAFSPDSTRLAASGFEEGFLCMRIW